MLHLLEECCSECHTSETFPYLKEIITDAVHVSLGKTFDKSPDKSRVVNTSSSPLSCVFDLYFNLQGCKVIIKLLENIHKPYYTYVGKLVDSVFFKTGPVDRNEIEHKTCKVSLELILSSDFWPPLIKFIGKYNQSRMLLKSCNYSELYLIHCNHSIDIIIYPAYVILLIVA